MKHFLLISLLLCSLPLWSQKELPPIQKKQLALTPPMGWNSWNYFACDINEQLVRDIADAMVSTGMKDAGYEYIVIDDCWQVARDENDRIIEDRERFPSGMKALVDYVHSKGLKFGIYSDAGRKTCQERPGSLGYEEIDARTYAKWGVDYLKYDWCHHGFLSSRKTYPIMGRALAELDHPIVFSVCNWGWSKPWEWAPDFAHLWRTTIDIEPCFDCRGKMVHKSVMQILDKQVGLEKYAGPGQWNDPDMLQVGNGEMTFEENRAHFALWCMLAAPLMAGNDLRNMDKEVLEILTHDELLAINQDKLGKQGYKHTDEGDIEVWVKDLEGGDKAVCVLNRGEEAVDWSLKWNQLLPEGSTTYRVRDVWERKDMGSTTDESYTFQLGVHGVQVVRLVK